MKSQPSVKTRTLRVGDILLLHEGYSDGGSTIGGLVRVTELTRTKITLAEIVGVGEYPHVSYAPTGHVYHLGY